MRLQIRFKRGIGMKKTMSLFLLTGLAGGLLSGCGNSGGNASPQASGSSASATSQASQAASTTPAKKNITLSYLASQDWIKDPEMKLAEKFEEQTGIHIDYQIVPSDQY